MIVLYVLEFMILLLLMGYSFLRYRHLWRRGRIPVLVYYVFQVVMLGTLFICQYHLLWISVEVLQYIAQIVSVIYFCVMVYTPIFCGIRGLIRHLGKKRKSTAKFYRFVNHPAKSIYLILGLTCMLGICSILTMKHVIRKHYEVNIAKENETDDLNIMMLSDLHMGSSVTRRQLDALVLAVNEQKPDLIVLCGDVFDENTSVENMQYASEKMKLFQSTYGTFCVEGDHETSLLDVYDSYFTDAGITVLRDQTARLTNGIQLVGAADDSDEEKEDISFLMSNLDKTKPVIVLSHQPKNLKDYSEAGADLVLCGHTLGGQIPLGFIPTLLTNDMNYGIKKYGTMSAVTTSGVGGYGIPIKLTVPSEIVTIYVTMK